MIPETGTFSDFKRCTLAELHAWTCDNGHHVVVARPPPQMKWVAAVEEYGHLWGCDYCILVFQEMFFEADNDY
jgi:hypothetical protein